MIASRGDEASVLWGEGGGGEGQRKSESESESESENARTLEREGEHINGARAPERRCDVVEIDVLSVDRPRDRRLDLGREVENDGDEIIRINEDLVDQRRVRESVESLQREPQPTPILLLRDA